MERGRDNTGIGVDWTTETQRHREEEEIHSYCFRLTPLIVQEVISNFPPSC